MQTRLQNAWATPTVAAYTWFLAPRAAATRTLIRPTLGTPNFTNQALGANRRFWQPRVPLRMQNWRGVGLLGCFVAVAYFTMTALTACVWPLGQLVVEAVSFSHAYSPFICAALAAALVLRQWVAFSTVVALSALTWSHATFALSCKPGVSLQLWATPAVDFNRSTPLVRAAFGTLSALALTEGAPCPHLRALTALTPLCTLPPLSNSLWVRVSALPSTINTNRWPSFGAQCAARAVTARSLATAWGRHGESMGAAQVNWNTRRTTMTQGLVATAGVVANRRSGPQAWALSSGTDFQFRLASATPLFTLHRQVESWQFVQTELVWAPVSLVNVAAELWDDAM